MGFRFKEHTADARVECVADTFQGLLETAAQALYAAALAQLGDEANVERRIELEADCAEDMLVRWLQELIFLADVEHFAATRFEFHTAGAERVEATLRGYHFNPQDREAEIKAATYHGMAVRETEEGLVAEVIFDL